MNLGQINTAMPYVQALAGRAGVSAPASSEINNDWIAEERFRELLWEGHRRTDLIRLGKFNSSNFLWAWKGGNYNGQGFDEHLNIFAIPATELAANPELHQNPGYTTVETVE